jgi:putative SOS response-associated peptidase YedK
MSSYNVAPLHIVPVARVAGGALQVSGMRWGLFPGRANGELHVSIAVNPGSEASGTAPPLDGSWKLWQRCLVLASGFYVWRAEAAGKQPWLVGCADQEVFAFAGLWDSSRTEAAEDFSCSILTLPASARMRDLENTRLREPAILRRQDWDKWLRGEPDAALASLRQYPDDLRVAWPVSKRVNSCMHNDAQLLERVTCRAEKPVAKPDRTLGRLRAVSGRPMQVVNRD